MVRPHAHSSLKTVNPPPPMDPKDSLSAAVAVQKMEPFVEGKTTEIVIDNLSASFIGDLKASMNAYQAKKVLSKNLNPSGENPDEGESFLDEKVSRRSAFRKRIVSRKKQKQRDKKQNSTGKKPMVSTKMSPHWGEDVKKFFTPSLTSLASWGGVDLTDEILREVEGLSALMLILTGANDYVTMSAGLFLYIREKFPRSISGQVIQYVQDVLNEGFSSQDGEELPKEEIAKGQNSWVQFVKDIKTNWTLCKGNRLFGQFSKILGLLVTFGLCNADSMTFDIKGYKLLEPDLKVVHGDAQDIISACCDTVVFWVESAYAAWKTKSLTPFLLGNSDASDLDLEYHELVKHWDLARNGNLLAMHGITDSEFVSRLELMATKLRRLLPTLRGLDKQVIERKFSNILSIINDHAISKMAAGYRRAPFAIEFHGPSSQGKTFCAEQITAALFASAGIDNSKGKKFVFDSSKKHWDGARSDINHFIINDHGNVKSDFVEVSPCDAIQKICDNAPCVAPMADLARKEKTWLEPELVTVTTNVMDLDARLYSNCPYSIQRRMHVVIEVRAKKQFQKVKDGMVCGLDSNLVMQRYTIDGVYTPPPFDDVWELDVSIAIPPTSLRASAPYKFIEWRGKQLVNVDMCTVVNYCIEMFHAHRREQFDLVRGQESRSRKIEICGINNCKQLKGFCLDHNFENRNMFTLDVRKQCEFVYDSDDESLEQNRQVVEEYPPELEELDRQRFLDSVGGRYRPHGSSEQWGDRIIGSTTKAANMIKSRLSKDVKIIPDFTESAVSTAVLFAARTFVKRFDWVQILPSKWLENDYVVKFCMLGDHKRLRDSYLRRTLVSWGLLGAGVGSLFYFNKGIKNLYGNLFCTASATACLGWRQMVMTKVVKNSYINDLVHRNSIAPMIKDLRDKHMENVMKASAIIGTIYAIAKLYKRWRGHIPHGSLEPTCEEDVKQRDAEANVWASVVKRSLPISKKSLLSCKDHVRNLVLKNLVYGSVESGNKILMVNGLFIRSNVVLIPNHYFEDSDDLRVTFRKANPDACGGKFVTRLDVKSSFLIPQSDMRVCYSSTGGSFKDILEYFPKEHFPEHNFVMLYRQKDGTVVDFEGKAKPCIVETVCKFTGGRYDYLSKDTFAGLCGATLVSRGSAGVITGLHLGGHEGTPHGCYGSFTQPMLISAIESLSKLEGVLLTGGSERFEPQVLGKVILTNEGIHKKNPITYMPEGSQIEYHGSCLGRVKSISRVKVTPISEIVTDVCGVPNKWGPPKMHPEWFGWQTCLANLSEPGEPFPHDILQRAVLDYKDALKPIFQSRLWNSAVPLDNHTNINGSPGRKFMDAIKISTSIGFPLTGAKSEFMQDVDVFDENGLLNRTFKPFIMEEILRCEESYKRGERAYPIAKACKKDEILAKEKCRIFYGNSIALTFLVRKYFLPLIRVLMMNPLKSECAVGINSHGPEWDELMKFLRSKDSEKFLAGDYSKFDQKLTSQVILAGLRILIDFADLCPGYTAEDKHVMKSMAGDIVYAVIAFDGNLISLTCGGHISGNPLTAVLNSICNSLNMRCCFYTIYPEAQSFREACALITYGDDNAGSVVDKYKGFNIASCSEVMSRYGQIYTMPDKESELTDFIDVSRLEFLKRKSVFHSALECEVGALSDDSCFKMLHCFVRDKNSPLSEEEACATNIDTALMEWFNHGEDVYEERRKQMVEVAAKAGITNLCTSLDVTYGDRCVDWIFKYRPHSGEEVKCDNSSPLYTKALTEIALKVVAIESDIIIKAVGEVDLAFHTTYKGVQHMVIMEIKDSMLPSARCKGRRQLHRMCEALAIINPKISYSGVLLTPRGYESVCLTGDDGLWEEMDLPFSMWMDVEQYERQIRLSLAGF